MKEITINIPDDSSELVIELVERLGGTVDEKQKRKKECQNPQRREKQSAILQIKRKETPCLYLANTLTFP